MLRWPQMSVDFWMLLTSAQVPTVGSDSSTRQDDTVDCCWTNEKLVHLIYTFNMTCSLTWYSCMQISANIIFITEYFSTCSSLPRKPWIIGHVANHELHAGAWMHAWQRHGRYALLIEQYYISNAFIIFLDNIASFSSRAFRSSLPKAAASGGGTAFPTCLCLF